MKFRIGLLFTLTLMVGSSQAVWGWDALCNAATDRFDRLTSWVADRPGTTAAVGVGVVAVCAAVAWYKRNNQADIKSYKWEYVVFSPSTSNHVQHQYGCVGIQGHRSSMEDVHAMITGGEADFFGVFDGHGGKEVADYVAKHLYPNILSEPSFASNPAQAIHYGCLKTDQEIIEAAGTGIFKDGKRFICKSGARPNRVGSTAIFALIQGDNIFVGNVGDSRAVLSNGGVVTALSKDQKPNRSDEKARIEASGGSVVWDDEGEVWRVNERLSVARAFGDVFIKTYVPAEPEILVHKIMPDDEFLILGCDGVWDVLSNQQAVKIVKDSLVQGKDLNAAALDLVKASLKAGSSDNISAVIVKLN